MSEAGPWRSRLKRWRWWIAAAVLIIVVRVALPEIVRRQIESQAAQNLRAEVTVGDVDLYLWRGGVVVEDLALLPLAEVVPPAAQPPATAAPPDMPGGTPVAAQPAPERQPIVAWKSLAVGVRYWPLRQKVARLYEIVLSAPEIHIDRLPNGDLNALLILPSPTPEGAGGTPGTASPATPSSPAASATPSPAPTAPAPETAPAGAGTTPPADAGTAGEDAASWLVGIDKLVIADGKGVFRDFMVAGSEPVEIGLPTIEARDLARDPRVYGGPSDGRVRLILDEGWIELGADASVDGQKVALKADLRAEGLPLRRSRVYVPDVGWSELRGVLDTALVYELETAHKNQVTGSVTLRDVAVIVPDVPDALSWKNLTVEVDPIDLFGASAAVKSVTLDDLVVTVHPELGFPVLSRVAGGATPEPSGEATPEATPTVEAAAEEASGAEPTPQTAPWKWSVASVRVNNGLVKVAGSAPIDVKVGAAVQSLSSEPGSIANVDLSLEPPAGSLKVAGNARIEPPGFGGKLDLDGLLVPDLIRSSGLLPESPVESARLSAALDVAAGLASATSGEVGPTDLRVGGKISIGEPKLNLVDRSAEATADAAARGIMVEASSLSVDIGRVDLPAVLDTSVQERRLDIFIGRTDTAVGAPRVALADGKQLSFAAKHLRATTEKIDLPAMVAPAGTVKPPIVVAAGDIVLDSPIVQLTRMASGPGTSGSEGEPATTPPEGSPEPEAAETPEPTAEAKAPSAPTPAGEPPVRVTLNSLRLKNGRVDVADEVVKPPVKLALRRMNVAVDDFRFPPVAMRSANFDTLTPGNGQIEVRGSLAPGKAKIQSDLRKVDLPTFNPYATTYSPFRIRGGALSVSSTVTLDGEAYDIGNKITLHQLGLSSKSRENPFEKEFGVPVSTALALMRDAKGDIALDVPVQVDPKGTHIDILAIAGGALRRALLNALTSPLRLLGVGGGDRVDIAPASIVFPGGQSDLAEEERQRLEQLGNLLASRPTIRVQLETTNTQIDARRLREQALRRDWESEGFFAGLLSLGQRDERGRIQQALEQRAVGKAGELSPEDEQTLEQWLAEIPPVGPEELTRLSQERLTKIESIVRGHAGVAPAQVQVAEEPPEIEEVEPEARIVLEPIEESAEPAGRP